MDFSTTGTLQSFQSSDDVNNSHHERLETTFSWDEEQQRNHADNVSLAQAIQDPEFIRLGQ